MLLPQQQEMHHPWHCWQRWRLQQDVRQERHEPQLVAGLWALRVAPSLQVVQLLVQPALLLLRCQHCQACSEGCTLPASGVAAGSTQRWPIHLQQLQEQEQQLQGQEQQQHREQPLFVQQYQEQQQVQLQRQEQQQAQHLVVVQRLLLHLHLTQWQAAWAAGLLVTLIAAANLAAHATLAVWLLLLAGLPEPVLLPPPHQQLLAVLQDWLLLLVLMLVLLLQGLLLLPVHLKVEALRLLG